MKNGLVELVVQNGAKESNFFGSDIEAYCLNDWDEVKVTQEDEQYEIITLWVAMTRFGFRRSYIPIHNKKVFGIIPIYRDNQEPVRFLNGQFIGFYSLDEDKNGNYYIVDAAILEKEIKRIK